MRITALQTKGVFAGDCQVGEGFIRVGYFALNDRALVGQTVTLIQTENPTAEAFTIRVPDLSPPAYNAILERV
jgi:hypothetical protein